MAGTLTVQNIECPSSGANANKIIIPSGQTLDASEGFVPPAGHVVQVVSATPNYQSIAVSVDALNQNWSSWPTLVTLSLTPKFSTSVFVAQASTNITSWATPNNGGQVAITIDDGTTVDIMMNSTGRAGDLESMGLYYSGTTGNNFWLPVSIIGNYDVGKSVPLTFALRGACETTGGTINFNSGKYGPAMLTVWEIAQ